MDVQAVKKGDRVRVRDNGDTGWLIDLRRAPTSWTYRRADPPSWLALVEFPDGTRQVFPADGVEQIEKGVVRGE